MRVVVTLDCLDLESQAAFWLAVLEPLEYRRGFDGSPYLSLVTDAGGPIVLLQRVPEPKQGKNRMHLDLGVERLDAEVERIERIGARRISEERAEHQFRWVVFADPESNEFCVYVQG